MSSLPLMIIDTQQAISSGLWIGIQTQSLTQQRRATDSSQKLNRTRETGLQRRAVPTPRTPQASIRRRHPQNRQGVRPANEGTQRPSQLYSTAKSEAWIFFWGGEGILSLSSGCFMDLEALCCTEERKISKTYNLQKRQTRTGTESMDVGRGEESLSAL